MNANDTGTKVAKNLSYRERLNLEVSVFGQDAVVCDGQFLWTADVEQLNVELEKISNESDDDQGCGGEIYAYASLCSRVQYLARTSPERHERAVTAWRQANDGLAGNWAPA